MVRSGPRYGQVARYWYLWGSEAFDGESQADKPRPCAVVVALKPDSDGTQRVMMCGITHSEPKPPSEGVLIPDEAKKDVGLDDEPSWIITSEVNKVKWSDSRFIRTPSGEWSYGDLPGEIMEQVRAKILERNKRDQMDVIDRDDIDKRVAGRDIA